MLSLNQKKLEEQTLDYLMSLPAVQEWPQLEAMLRRITTATVRHWELPAIACQAVGGSPTQAVAATASMVALFLSIVLVDDMIDCDPKGYHMQEGSAATSHLAVALQALGLEAIAHSHASLEVQARVMRKLNSMLLSVALGQYWDIHNPQDEASYWRIVETKSGPFFGAALYAGAFMGSGDEKVATQLETIGRIYGELIQLHDDLHDVMQTPANPDWTEGRSPLPILFASQVNHPDQARFLRLRQQVDDPAALAEAQTILIHCGAVSYLIDQLLQRQQKASALLAALPLADSHAIDELLKQTSQPLHQLLEAV